MLVTVDKVGRLVIPKSLRDTLGIGPETSLELTVEGAALRLEPVYTRERGFEVVDGFPRLEPIDHLTLTDDDIRRLRDELNR